MPGVPVTAIARTLERLPLPARRAIVIVLRLAVAAVFVAAAIPKLADPSSFAEDVANYRMLPDLLVGPVAVALPIVELLIGAALITGVHAAGAAMLAGALLLVFAVGMSQAMARGIDLDCGCFGAASEMQVSGLTIARNLLLTVACIPIVLARRGDEPPRPTSEPELETEPEA